MEYVKAILWIILVIFVIIGISVTGWGVAILSKLFGFILKGVSHFSGCGFGCVGQVILFLIFLGLLALIC